MDRGKLRQAMTESVAHRGKLLVTWHRLCGSSVDAVHGHRAVPSPHRLGLMEARQNITSTAVINIWYVGGLGFYRDPLLERQKAQEYDRSVAGD